MEALWAADPEAAKGKDRFHCLPLHRAVACEASLEVVQALVAAGAEK